MPRPNASARDGSDWIPTVALLLIAAKVVLVSLVFDPRGLVVFALPKALVSHGLGYVLLGVLVAHLVRHGHGALRWTVVHVFLASYVVINAVAAAFALDPFLALHGAHDRAMGLATLWDNATLFTAAVVFVRTARELAVVTASALAGLLLILGYEAAQLLGADPISWASGAYSRTRPFATFGNSGVLGQYLGTLAAGALGLALTVPSQRYRAALGLVGAAAATSSVLTGTRSVAVGLGAAAVFIVGAQVIRTWPRMGAHERLALAAGGVGTAVVLGAALFVTPFGQRATSFVLASTEQAIENPGAAARSISGRLVIYSAAVDAVRARPALGVGPDNFVAVFPTYRPETSWAALATTAPETSPHGWPWHVAVSSGLLGLLVFGAVLATAAVVAARRRFPGVSLAAGAMVASFLGTGLVTVNDVGTEWLLWVALAMVAGSVATDAPADEARRPAQRRGWRASLVPGAIVIGVIMAATPYSAWAANERAGASGAARAAGAFAQAIFVSEQAIDQDPRRAEYWNGLGLAYAGAGRFLDATRAFAKAVDLAPYHATYLSNLARAHLTRARAGDAESGRQALATADRAVQVDPNNGESHFARAVVQLFLGTAAEAARESERGLVLYPAPRDASVYELGARAYIELQDYALAERWLEKAIAGSERPGQWSARVLLARVFLTTSRRTAAIEQLDVVLLQDPGNDQATRLKAEILARAVP